MEVVHRAFPTRNAEEAARADERPDHRRVVAYVTLEEGPTMMTRIIDAPENIAIGDAVTVDFEANPDGLTGPVFRRT